MRYHLSFIILASMAATAHAQERQWTLDTSDEDAYLVFGVPESDDVGLSIWCTIESGKTKIFLPEATRKLKPGRRAIMRLSAGKVTVSVHGVATDNRDAGTASIEAEVETGSPIYPAMETADRLRVVVAGHEQIFPLTDADVEGLLKLCRKP